MGYVFKNQYGVLTAEDENQIGMPKKIRFITSDYKELFQIPDGGSVLLCHADGEKKEYKCKYLDDYHLLFGNRAYHICELAENLERNGAHCVPFPEKRIIWSDMNLDLKDWIANLRENYPELGREELTEKMYEANYNYLEDERINLKIDPVEDILVIGDIGRWDGRKSGYKEIHGGYISDCLYSECDSNEWYVNREGELCSTNIHHDGTNYYVYRAWKPEASEEQRVDLKSLIYNGKATKKDIDLVTDKLGFKIADVYGWDFPIEKAQIRTERETR